jgi:hypothetical protein
MTFSAKIFKNQQWYNGIIWRDSVPNFTHITQAIMPTATKIVLAQQLS